MKKLILLFAAIAISAGAYAQTDSTFRQMNQRNMNQHQRMLSNPVDKSVPDGVMMQNGKIMKVKNGEMTTLDHDMTMGNGTKIMTDGNYTNNDGLTLMLKERQHIDMEGNMTFIKADKYKNMHLVPDSTRNKVY
jgi:Ni/Co efflux regulator RcnB